MRRELFIPKGSGIRDGHTGRTSKVKRRVWKKWVNQRYGGCRPASHGWTALDQPGLGRACVKCGVIELHRAPVDGEIVTFSYKPKQPVSYISVVVKLDPEDAP